MAMFDRLTISQTIQAAPLESIKNQEWILRSRSNHQVDLIKSMRRHTALAGWRERGTSRKPIDVEGLREQSVGWSGTTRASTHKRHDTSPTCWQTRSYQWRFFASGLSSVGERERERARTCRQLGRSTSSSRYDCRSHTRANRSRGRTEVPRRTFQEPHTWVCRRSYRPRCSRCCSCTWWLCNEAKMDAMSMFARSRHGLTQRRIRTTSSICLNRDLVGLCLALVTVGVAIAATHRSILSNPIQSSIINPIQTSIQSSIQSNHQSNHQSDPIINQSSIQSSNPAFVSVPPTDGSVGTRSRRTMRGQIWGAPSHWPVPPHVPTR